MITLLPLFIVLSILILWISISPPQPVAGFQWAAAIDQDITESHDRRHIGAGLVNNADSVW